MFWKEETVDRENTCGNCGRRLRTEDRYCRVCGTRRGEGAFVPNRNLMQCIYGPRPIERGHKCTQCGYSWIAVMMVDNQKYCPQCGSRAEEVPPEEVSWVKE